MTIDGLSHAQYILLAYGATFAVLLLLLAQSLISWRRARRAVADAGLAAGGEDWGRA